MSRIIFFSLLLLITSATVFHTTKGKGTTYTDFDKRESNESERLWQAKLKSKALAAKSYVAKNGFNTTLVFLIDMNISSGNERFFVYHLQKDSVVQSGLVTHGRCNEWWLEGRRYSNVVGSGCSSLGKYRIGHSYSGKFGLAYKLHGLESSNNNAFERYVVLHAHACVPDENVEDEICQSDGCPTVSPGFLKTIQPMLDHSAKPVMLWIYDSSEVTD